MHVMLLGFDPIVIPRNGGIKIGIGIAKYPKYRSIKLKHEVIRDSILIQLPLLWHI